ncbi:protein NRT1/ PTR FAMILY 5.9-like [Mangifera indica]|uniref:protein NRT1/ PTR FAMILY 5.9-like n=1 Tax=Mangifera indica TaxID=29780 RepID=UPI001CFA5D79|nr:protein NRT1/ PTR FAMILY 5.9-like [Mangifera indica]
MAGGHRNKGLCKSCIMLIVIAGTERLAFKGVASNLVTYLTDVVKMSNSLAAKTVNSWCGFTSMLPLLVAPLADSYWDRYSTILAFSFIYAVGLVALTSTAFTWAWSPPNSTSSSSFLFWSLFLISLGQGGYNPSLQAFGADQLDTGDEELPTSKDQKSSIKSLFFKWWYFGVCSGSLLGVTVMSYIQDTFGWVLGFAIPTVAMVTSLVFLSFGVRLYMKKSEKHIQGKPFLNIVQAIKAAASKLMDCKTALPIEKPDLVEQELQEKPLCPQNLGSSKDSVELENPTNGAHLLQNARVVIRILPIWLMLLMFAVLFQQPATFFTKQGMTMERNIGSNFKIPPATLQSAITVSIILLMPLYDTVLIPMIQMITRNEKGINVMQRMGIGMFLSIIAMTIAATVETKRLELSKQTGKISESETVPLSIFYLLPQYILLGISDIFTVVGMQEFFYNEVPVRMRTMAFALYTSVFGVGSFLSALLISIIEVLSRSRGGQSWFSDDMREARLDKFYWFLALASALSLVLYVIFCKFYRTGCDSDSVNRN